MSDDDRLSADEFDYEESIDKDAEDKKDNKATVYKDQPYDEAIELSGSDNESVEAKTPTKDAPAPAPSQAQVDASKGHDELDPYDNDSFSKSEDESDPGSEDASEDEKAAQAQAQAQAQARRQMDLSSPSGSESSSEDDGDEDGSGDEYEGIRGPAGYNPAEFANLKVSSEIQELFQYIQRYNLHSIELEARLKPFIPDYIPAVGDIDAFIKIPRPDSKPDSLGLTVLDEPTAQQTDPTVLDLQLRSLSKSSNLQPMVVRSIEQADKNPKAITNWVQSINDLHRNKPLPDVIYSKAMPDIETLMQLWPQEFEDLLQTTKMPTADIDMDIKTYIRMICALLDIPVYEKNEKNKSLVESVHVLFTLYSEFKNNQHFSQAQTQPEVNIDIVQPNVNMAMI